MDTFKIKPAREGLIVRDPKTRQPLAADGEVKPQSTYWFRRKRDGDVVVIEPEDKPDAKPEDKPEDKPEAKKPPRQPRATGKPKED